MSGSDLKPSSLISMFALLLICVILMYSIDSLTREKIQENRLAASTRIFNDIIPFEYTNDIFRDSSLIDEPDYFRGPLPVTINRIRNGDNILGVIIYPVIARGYKSNIELGIGIDKDGLITGVRVLYEDETIGLGDQVHQSKSGWIDVFSGKSLEEYSRDQWRVRSDGGLFDEISGATITARSVINAVRSTLDYHNIARDEIYSEE